MFIHNFKYSLKILFRNRMLIFWTFAFPIILGTLFNLAFSDIEKKEKLELINIAIINNDSFNNNEIYKTTLKKLSDKKNKDRLFKTKYTTKNQAKKLLDDKKIIGCLEIVNNEPKINIMNNGINETIFKYVTEEISQTNDIVKNITEKEIDNQIKSGNYNIDYNKITKNVDNIINQDSINIKDISNNKLSYTMIEFYTLIAMTCLYGGMLGAFAINQSLANMSNKGKRIAISPSKKRNIILSSVLASYITQLIGLFILFMYTIFLLKIDYGNNILLIIILAMVGSLAGLSLGIFVATLLKKDDNTKTGIIIAFTMVGCFLSGMMGISMKYIIDKNIPIINKINPASMITDGFYSLYYYDTLDRYLFNIISLLVFSFILISISCISLRRQRYDSI